MDLANKIAVISGGASGMGKATARLLGQSGCKVVILDHNSELAQQTAKEIGSTAYSCDVSDPRALEKVIQKIVDQHQAIHIAVSCAGIATGERVIGREGPASLAEFNQVIQVNLVGTFNLLRLAAVQMTKQEPTNEDGERGVIINTASIAAFEGQIGQAAYSASKGGIVSMTLPIARELGKFGIRVMTIAPGTMQTPMFENLPEKVQTGVFRALKFPDRLGKSDEFATLAKHIIENAYLNGSVIRLDGGIRMTAK